MALGIVEEGEQLNHLGVGSSHLGYAAALRLAHFGEANEHSDWETAHHAFTYCNAVHQALKRIGPAAGGTYCLASRGVFHGAIAVYLCRYLNVPPAPLPSKEDAGFHAYQALEAGLRQFREWGETSTPACNILIGVTRYLAAHWPTARSIAQTARTAEKLMLGG